MLLLLFRFAPEHHHQHSWSCEPITQLPNLQCWSCNLWKAIVWIPWYRDKLNCIALMWCRKAWKINIYFNVFFSSLKCSAVPNPTYSTSFFNFYYAYQIFVKFRNICWKMSLLCIYASKHLFWRGLYVLWSLKVY